MEEGEASDDSSEQQQQEEEEEEEEEEEINEISAYEQQRLSRIRENKARLEALGLPSLSSSLIRAFTNRRQSKGEAKPKNRKKNKKKGEDDDDDEEYQPSDEDDRGENNDEDSDEAEEQEEKQNVGTLSSPNSRQKGKKRTTSDATRVEKSLLMKRNRLHIDEIDEDATLQQAIALSLGGNAEVSAAASDMVSASYEIGAGSGDGAKKEKARMQESAGKRKSSKMNKSRVQLTEDEVIAYFFSFDEAGKGHISQRDLQRMVLAHDFNWTEIDIASMIHSFDSDRDGKLSLDNFRTIVCRCNMMQETGNP